MRNYDPFWIYDSLLDQAYEMEQAGFDNLEDYAEYLEDLKNDTQCKDYESKMGY
jgi:hypothetical protein